MTQSLTSFSVQLGLPGRYYTDPEIYARELKSIWRSTWQWVGRVEQLPNPGDYLTCIIGEEPILVIRTAEGLLQAMHNVCPHRGARLLMDQEGNCNHKIICPYHAWTYDLEGQLLGVSQPNLFPNFDKSKIQLSKARVDVWGGFIFINPDSEGESLMEYLADYPRYLSQYNQSWEDLRYIHTYVYEEPINWKFLVENYVEDYHFSVTHAKTLVPIFDVEHIRTVLTGRHIQIPVPFAAKEPEGIFKDYWEKDGISYQGFLFPNAMINTSKDHVSVWRITPLGPQRTRLESVIYQTPDQFAKYPFKAEQFGEVMEEDFAVCRLLQAGVNSRAYQVAQLAVEHELGVAHFHQILSQYL